MSKKSEWFDGCTHCCFGPFEALTSGKTLEETNTRPVWKVWSVADNDKKTKIAERLLRIDAIELAQKLAVEWREQGRPRLS